MTSGSPSILARNPNLLISPKEDRLSRLRSERRLLLGTSIWPNVTLEDPAGFRDNSLAPRCRSLPRFSSPLAF